MKKIAIAGVIALALTTATASAAEASPWKWLIAPVAAVVGVALSPTVVAAATVIGAGVAVIDLVDD